MGESKNLARVILRSNGTIHVAFQDVRAITATANNLMALFSDPIEFIEKGSLSCKESTFTVNRQRVELDEVLGLTLASVNSDKQIVCDFPELFQYIFYNITEESSRDKPLNMSDFEHRTLLSDEKAYLLHFYLEFTQNLRSRVGISKNIKLREEVQIAIMREILNTYFEEELPKPAKAADLSKQIDCSESNNLLKAESMDRMVNMVNVYEYAKIIDRTPDSVRKYIQNHLLKSAVKVGQGYLIDRDDRPIDFDKRKGRKRKKTGEEKFFKRAMEGSPEEVREYIRKNNFFSDDVGKYIRSYAEFTYYEKNNYHEVVFNGRNCLIIDVVPEYIVPDNMVPQKVKNRFPNEPDKVYRNRDLMEAGCPPVVPQKQKDQFVFHVHHVGQRPESPFCAIPEYDHISKELSTVFHQGSYSSDLHGPEFEAQKGAFWREYIRQYDIAEEFSKIPYRSPKRTRNEKSKA